MLVRLREEVQEVLRGLMTTKRNSRTSYPRMVVRLPDRDLSESIRWLADPLLAPLGAKPPPDEARRVLELAINIWNSHVAASLLWGAPKQKPLTDLRKTMCGKQATPGLAEVFELLSARWRSEFAFDPRIVGEWSLEMNKDGQYQLACETTLLEGIEAEVPPPAEKRIAIGGKFLDEVRIRLDRTSYLGFPVENHRAEIATDGTVTIWVKMPTAIQLFADGRLTPIGGAPVQVMIGGKELGAMVLSELSCAGDGGYHDVAMLVFRRANPTLAR
jgi:hypothetical protein